eukprot:5851419-Pyramimonas_sp.AAC.1
MATTTTTKNGECNKRQRLEDSSVANFGLIPLRHTKVRTAKKRCVGFAAVSHLESPCVPTIFVVIAADIDFDIVHGQGEHNVAVENAGGDKSLYNSYDYYDARLTAFGWEQSQVQEELLVAYGVANRTLYAYRSLEGTHKRAFHAVGRGAHCGYHQIRISCSVAQVWLVRVHRRTLPLKIVTSLPTGVHQSLHTRYFPLFTLLFRCPTQPLSGMTPS